MSRTVPEWIAKSDDSAIPDRVKLRVHDRAKGRCVVCTLTASSYELDHIVPLILGDGLHRETNLQLLCKPCHKAKTKMDVKFKSIIARKRAKHLGIRKPSRMKSAGFRKSAPQRTASRPIERRT